MEQEIEIKIREDLDDNYVILFDGKANGKTVLIKEYESEGNKIVSYINRPCKAKGILY